MKDIDIFDDEDDELIDEDEEEIGVEASKTGTKEPVYEEDEEIFDEDEEEEGFSLTDAEASGYDDGEETLSYEEDEEIFDEDEEIFDEDDDIENGVSAKCERDEATAKQFENMHEILSGTHSTVAENIAVWHQLYTEYVATQSIKYTVNSSLKESINTLTGDDALRTGYMDIFDEVLSLFIDIFLGIAEGRFNTDVKKITQDFADTVGEIMFERFDFLIQTCGVTVPGADYFMGKLKSSLRKVGFREYFTNAYFIQDMRYITKFLSKYRKPTVISKEAEGSLKLNYSQQLTETRASISKHYKAIYKANFGTNPFVGVFAPNMVKVDKASTSKKPVEILNAPNTLSKIASDTGVSSDTLYASWITSLYNYYSVSSLQAMGFGDITNTANLKGFVVNGLSNGEPLYDSLKYQKILINTQRSYPVDLMANLFVRFGKDAPVIYSPYKVLELVSKAEFTNDEYNTDNTYTTKTELSTVDAYAKYLVKQLEPTLLRYCLTVLKLKHIDIQDVSNKNLQTVRNIWYAMTNYFVSCVFTSMIVRDFGYKFPQPDTEGHFSSSHINVATFKFILVSPCLRYTANSQFLGYLSSLSTSGADTYKDFEDTKAVSIGTVSMLDANFVFDTKYAYGIPEFAMGALDVLGAGISYKKNILLGKNLRDELVTSSPNEALNLQKQRYHFIMAGSRAGKGVMCSTIFCTAVISGIPIFYMDRKPDSCIELLNMSKNKMYAVNGNQYESDIDYNGYMKAWTEKSSYKLPLYLDNAEGLPDLAYIRGIMLYIEMCRFADVGNPQSDKAKELKLRLRNALSGGSICVIDEVTNFGRNTGIANKLIEPSKAKTLPNIARKYVPLLSKSIEDIEKLEVTLHAKQSAKKQDEAAITLTQNKLRRAKESQAQIFAEKDYQDMYLSIFDDSLTSLGTMYANWGNAGKSVLYDVMQFYFIGQGFQTFETHLGKVAQSEKKGADENKVIYSGEDKYSVDASSPVWRLLNIKGTVDFLIGYHRDNTTWLAQYRTPNSQRLSADRRMFAYRTAEFNLDTLKNITNTDDSFKSQDNANSWLSDWTYIKPYLILNNGICTPCVQDLWTNPELAPVRQGKAPVPAEMLNQMPPYAIKDGKLTPSQFVGQCISSCITAGVEWQDVVNRYKTNRKDANGNPLNEISLAVGLQGYLAKSDNLPEDADIPQQYVEKLGLSGDLATEYVRVMYGYSGTYADFLRDLRIPYFITGTEYYNADGSYDLVKRVSELKGIKDLARYKDSLGGFLDFMDTPTKTPVTPMGGVNPNNNSPLGMPIPVPTNINMGTTPSMNMNTNTGATPSMNMNMITGATPSMNMNMITGANIGTETPTGTFKFRNSPSEKELARERNTQYATLLVAKLYTKLKPYIGSRITEEQLLTMFIEECRKRGIEI